MTPYEASNRQNQSEYSGNSVQYHKNQPMLSSEFNSHSEFSFSKQLKKSDHRPKHKYHDLEDDLKQMDFDDIVELLLDEIQENEESKMQIESMKGRIITYEEQLSSMKAGLKKKSEAIALLCETESKNLQLIERLEVKLSKKKDYPKDTYYEKKYQQLSVYMNEYIRSINQAQQQFKRVYSSLKTQNQRIEKQLERNQLESIKNQKKYQLQSQQVKRLQSQLGELFDKNKNIEHHYFLMKQENEILRKEIEIYQENIRITDRLEMQECQENQQLSSELDFIRDKILENENISKDIIERLEQSSLNYEKIVKVKEQLNQSLAKEKKKINELQKQINLLRKMNEKLQSQKCEIQDEHKRLKAQKQERDAIYLQAKAQKQGIQRQLHSMTQKIQLMESTYRRQIQKNEKIKEELCKFWQNKQKNDYVVLSQVKLNQCSDMNSISTFSYAETHNNHSYEIHQSQTIKSRSFKKPSLDNAESFKNKQNNQNYGMMSSGSSASNNQVSK